MQIKSNNGASVESNSKHKSQYIYNLRNKAILTLYKFNSTANLHRSQFIDKNFQEEILNLVKFKIVNQNYRKERTEIKSSQFKF